MSQAEHDALLDGVTPLADEWFTIWWYASHIEAAALGHPWWRIPHGPLMLQTVNVAVRPYRYTMRRKVRRMAGL